MPIDLLYPIEITYREDPGNSTAVLTAEELTAGEIPSLEALFQANPEILEEARNRINRNQIEALQRRVSGNQKFHLFRKGELDVYGTSQEIAALAKKVAADPGERAAVIRFVNSSETVPTFVCQLLNTLATDNRNGVDIAGEIFHGIENPKKQEAILFGINNIGAGARSLASAKARTKDPHYYLARENKWGDLQNPKKLLIVLLTEGASNIGLENHPNPKEAREAHDTVLQLFATYYQNPGPEAYFELTGQLESLRISGPLTRYELGLADDQGWIDSLEVEHRIPVIQFTMEEKTEKQKETGEGLPKALQPMYYGAVDAAVEGDWRKVVILLKDVAEELEIDENYSKSAEIYQEVSIHVGRIRENEGEEGILKLSFAELTPFLKSAEMYANAGDYEGNLRAQNSMNNYVAKYHLSALDGDYARQAINRATLLPQEEIIR